MIKNPKVKLKNGKIVHQSKIEKFKGELSSNILNFLLVYLLKIVSLLLEFNSTNFFTQALDLE